MSEIEPERVTEDEPVSPERMVMARATVHLPGFPAGSVQLIDQSSDYVRECLDMGLVVLVDPPTPLE